MIGQKHLTDKITEILAFSKFPRFTLFVGEVGSGRRTIIKELLTGLGMYTERGIDVESVRETIEQAYTTVSPMLYVFTDADNMSVAARNALLKVTEEPPNNAYFIMTLVNAENTLPTIRSRATVFHMDVYNENELLAYYKANYDGQYTGLIKTYCQTPGDIDRLCGYNVAEFHKFITMVLDNVEKVSGANSFKIGNRLNLKKEGDDDSDKGYDLALFFKAFRGACLEELHVKPFKYISGINVTSTYLYQLRTAGINKQMVFDNWLLDIRREWMQYADSDSEE